MAWILLASLYIGAACRDRPHCEAVLPPLADVKYFEEALISGKFGKKDLMSMFVFVYMVNADNYTEFDKDLNLLKEWSPICVKSFGSLAKYECDGFWHLKNAEAQEFMVEFPDKATYRFNKTKELFEDRVAKLSDDARVEIKANFKEIFDLIKETGTGMVPKMKNVFSEIVGFLF